MPYIFQDSFGTKKVKKKISLLIQSIIHCCLYAVNIPLEVSAGIHTVVNISEALNIAEVELEMSIDLGF